MKAWICLLAAAVACGKGAHEQGLPAIVDAGGSASTDPADAGTVATAPPTPDAGPIATTPPPDAGVSAACPGTPQLLWSRTLTTDADFRGVADADGNLYWLEFDPQPFDGPTPAIFLVSGDGDGNVRYRVQTTLPFEQQYGQFLLVSGKILSTPLGGGAVSAFDAATGAPAWTLNVSGTSSIADLGNGNVAFAAGNTDGSKAPGSFYVVDVSSGRVVASSDFSPASGYGVLGSNGQGQFLSTIDATFNSDTFSIVADLFVFDSKLQPLSAASIDDGYANGNLLLAWPSGGSPWLRAGDAPAASRSGYLATPSSWFPAVAGAHEGFSVDFFATPLTVHKLHDGNLGTDVSFPGFDPIAGVAVLPFLSGDHLLMLASKQHGRPALCSPVETTGTSLIRVDASTAFECPMASLGQSEIMGAALLPGRLVIARRTIVNASCTHDLQPVTIEAYALPGESLATSGWVQSGGNPGQGLRPIVP